MGRRDMAWSLGRQVLGLAALLAWAGLTVIGMALVGALVTVAPLWLAANRKLELPVHLSLARATLWLMDRRGPWVRKVSVPLARLVAWTASFGAGVFRRLR